MVQENMNLYKSWGAQKSKKGSRRIHAPFRVFARRNSRNTKWANIFHEQNFQAVLRNSTKRRQNIKLKAI
jgi:hypothetical protein